MSALKTYMSCMEYLVLLNHIIFFKYAVKFSHCFCIVLWCYLKIPGLPSVPHQEDGPWTGNISPLQFIGLWLVDVRRLVQLRLACLRCRSIRICFVPPFRLLVIYQSGNLVTSCKTHMRKSSNMLSYWTSFITLFLGYNRTVLKKVL